MRTFAPGDAEPKDRPDLYTIDSDLDALFCYRYEYPNSFNRWTGGWWVSPGSGDLWNWEDLWRDCDYLTENTSGNPNER